MSTHIQMWVSTTTAGIQTGIREGSGATQLIQICERSFAKFQYATQHVKGAIHPVKLILKRAMSLLAEGAVRCGQPQSLMTISTPMWDITTTAGIQMGILLESGASPLTPTRSGSTALFQDVREPVKRAIQWVLVIPERQI